MMFFVSTVSQEWINKILNLYDQSGINVIFRIEEMTALLESQKHRRVVLPAHKICDYLSAFSYFRRGATTIKTLAMSINLDTSHGRE